jgi:hypothetical protein
MHMYVLFYFDLAECWETNGYYFCHIDCHTVKAQMEWIPQTTELCVKKQLEVKDSIYKV